MAFFCPPIEVTAIYIYIYVYTHSVSVLPRGRTDSSTSSHKDCRNWFPVQPGFAIPCVAATFGASLPCIPASFRAFSPTGIQNAKYKNQRPWVYPYPSVSDFADETQTMVQTGSDQNSNHARLCIYQGKEKLRPWSEFSGKEKLRPWSELLGRENSDHGLNFGLPTGGGRSCFLRKQAVQSNGLSATRFSKIATSSPEVREKLQLQIANRRLLHSVVACAASHIERDWQEKPQQHCV